MVKKERGSKYGASKNTQFEDKTCDICCVFLHMHSTQCTVKSVSNFTALKAV